MIGVALLVALYKFPDTMQIHDLLMAIWTLTCRKNLKSLLYPVSGDLELRQLDPTIDGHRSSRSLLPPVGYVLHRISICNKHTVSSIFSRVVLGHNVTNHIFSLFH